MKRIRLGNCLEASQVALGCMRMAALTVEEAERVVNLVMEKGVDFFDHADIYGGGESERRFAQVLKRNPGMREKMLIQGKVGICKGYYDASYDHIIEAAEGCLERLDVDSMDVLLLHRPDALMEPEEVASAFAKLEKAGKVKVFGVSNMNAVQIELLNREMPGKIRINQLQFGPAFTGLVDEGINVNTGNDQAIVRAGGVLDYCRLHSITIQPWSPLQYGCFQGPFMLCEKYDQLNAVMHELALQYGVADETIAFAWILRHPAKMQPILGSMNPERIAAAAKAMEIRLTRPEWYKMYAAAGNPIP
jgi:predicted oxidoreductase